jgi:aryl-alcohol dehydrogenase-like predicted oxidoreductase
MIGIILGTAMWGWTVARETCFALLDEFYQQGFREIDAATNYPIDKCPEDFRKAENILLEWIHSRQVKDLKVMMKVGSLDNMRGPENNLTRSFLLMNLDYYRHLFDSNLDTFMVHWDNRDDSRALEETMRALDEVRQQGLRVGLSGIRFPALYAQLNREFGIDFRIQIKHNLLHSDYQRYKAFHEKNRFIAYGINAGGLKLDPSEYSPDSSLKARGGRGEALHPILDPLGEAIRNADRQADRPPIENFNHCGLVFAFYHPGMEGIIIGPSRPEQLAGSLRFYESMKHHDYKDFYESLYNIHHQYARS